MLENALAVGFALFLWWFGTGLIVYLDGLHKHTFKLTMLAASLLALAALVGLAQTSDNTSFAGALCSFSCGLVLWGWQEISYFLGYVTGTRKQLCEHNCKGWRHFVHAIQVNLYHELAIIAGAVIVVGLTWNAPNQLGTWTYLLLWWMQLSAKLNVFLGVRNLSEEFLPDHMFYMKSFLTRKKMNFLFPFSVTILTVLCVYMVQQAAASAPGSFIAVYYSLLATIVAMALLEHWLLVLPIPATAMWNWWMDLRDRRKQTVEAADKGLFSIDSSAFPRQALADGPVTTIKTTGTHLQQTEK